MKILIVFGTRPEAIKMAMVIKSLQKEPSVELVVCFTGQHKEMVLPLIDFFELPIHHSLDIMTPNQSLVTVSSRSLEALDALYKNEKPDYVFVQGDTTTAMCAAIAAFYLKIKIGHIEAGLRTYNMQSPFPEEFNRQVIAKIANVHFAPTRQAKQNLIQEGIPENNISITGNTVIDALLFTQNVYSNKVKEDNNILPWEESKKPYILITGHRRENFGTGFENICNAINELANKYPDFNFVYPVHLNPNVQEPVQKTLSGKDNIFLIEPMDYVAFTNLLSKCYFILTDSGGVQEEAPALGKPVLVMRDTTEREEAIIAKVAQLVGSEKNNIVKKASQLIEDKSLYNQMSTAQNPFGDGTASEKIVAFILERNN
jgi:UDP-N-acetylglucosamine 2-epimerase (non-hydrolysing)